MAVTRPNTSTTPPMMPMLLLLLSAVALRYGGVQGSYEHTCTLATRSRGAHPYGICGKNLARIVSILCAPRGYVGNWFTKRSASKRPASRAKRFASRSDVIGDAGLGPTRDAGFVNEKLRGILLNKREALSYLQTRDHNNNNNNKHREPRATRRAFGSQGITCECCYNRCSYYELLQYCN
ncbi:con-Ins Im2-like [Babylonia areolata]|uniref:con-Ins Im2-like n=1 Tax=Babylonia areolata TaxID=304850 RepID=UPI003FD19953